MRDIERHIGLLEARVRQPGTTSLDLVALKDEIYNKFDQFYLSSGVLLPKDAPPEKVTARRHSRNSRHSRDQSVASSKPDSNTGSERASPGSHTSKKGEVAGSVLDLR